MKTLFYSIIVSAVLVLAAEAVLVDGYCFLGGQTNHQGTKVKFQVYLAGVTDSTYTDTTGYYQINLAIGYYNVYFTHQGYWDEEIPGQEFSFNTTLPSITLTGGGIPISGPLSGILTDTTYLVVDDIYVPYSLIIEAGAILIFNDMANFYISGNLHADGSETDSIKFINRLGFSWGGIDFNIYYSDSSRLEYCLITGSSSGGIYCNNSSPYITNCTISGNNDGGIHCGYYSSPDISNCTISGNTASWGGGIYCYDNSSPAITNCTISGNNGRGILCDEYSSPDISNCTISGNNDAGIHCGHSSPVITNCTISGNTANDNGGGIFCAWYSSPVITNCTISGNTANDNGGGISCFGSTPAIINCTISENTAINNGSGIYCEWYSSPYILNTIAEGNYGNYCVYLLEDNLSNITITYSDFYNNQNGNFHNVPQGVGTIETVNANGDSCDIYHNIFLDPLFYSTTGDSAYYLTANSPCIDAGDPTSPLDPDSTIADIGAFYFDQNLGVENTIFRLSPLAFSLETYPNPFNDETNIQFSIPVSGKVTILVYDLQGKEVIKLYDGECVPGAHNVRFKAGNLASGIYFVRMKDQGFEQIRNIMLIK